ncbi:Small ubiquitin-related modifier 1 [Linum perenne]
MEAYGCRQSLDIRTIAFLFDGRRVHAEQTPAQVSSLIHSLILCL